MARILYAKGKTFFIRDISKDFHTQYGYVTVEDLKAHNGATIKTHTGVHCTIHDASFIDYYEKIKRGPQIVPRKDIGLFVLECGITRDSVIVDAGTGSGAVSCYLASIAKEVHTVDVREDHHAIAKKNFEHFKFKNVHYSVGNIYEEAPITDADAFFLDVPEPKDAIASVKKALKVGGFLCSYSPCTTQVSDLVEELRNDPCFEIIKTVEVSERQWEVKGRKVRPKSTSIGHSGFLTFVRKIKC